MRKTFGIFTLFVVAMAASQASGQDLLGYTPGQMHLQDMTVRGQCDAKDGSKDDLCCGGSSWFAQADLVFLKYANQFGVTGPATAGSTAWHATPRVQVGWIADGGFGIRGRWFEFDGVDNMSATETLRNDLLLIDLEAFESYEIGCNAEIEWSAGLRYADYTRQATIGATFGEHHFNGFGLISGLELRREIGDYTRFFANGRVSVIVGDQRQILVTPPGTVVQQNDNVAASLEMQLGVERDLWRLGDGWFARAYIEYDTYDGYLADNVNVVGPGTGVGEERIGVYGGGIAVGVLR